MHPRAGLLVRARAGEDQDKEKIRRSMLTFGRVGLGRVTLDRIHRSGRGKRELRLTAETRHHPPQLQIKTTGTVQYNNLEKPSKQTG